jgi:hypothetical protein
MHDPLVLYVALAVWIEIWCHYVTAPQLLNLLP